MQRELKLRAWNARWSEDHDGNLHARIEIESSETVAGLLREYDWTVYDHPTEGWQVVALVVSEANPGDTKDIRLLCDADESDGDAQFVKWVGVNDDANYHEWLNDIRAEMYEIGKLGVKSAMAQNEDKYKLSATFAREDE